MAPTTTLEQDWLAAIQREEGQDGTLLKPEHRSTEPGITTTTAAPSLNFAPKKIQNQYYGSFSPSPAFAPPRLVQQKMSPAASHPSSAAGVKLQLEIKKSREVNDKKYIMMFFPCVVHMTLWHSGDSNKMYKRASKSEDL